MLMRVYGCRPFISLHLLPHCLLVCRFMHHAHFKAVYDALDGVCNVRHSLLSPATRDSLHRFLSGCRTVSADPVVSLIPSRLTPHPHPSPPTPPRLVCRASLRLTHTASSLSAYQPRRRLLPFWRRASARRVLIPFILIWHLAILAARLRHLTTT